MLFGVQHLNKRIFSGPKKDSIFFFPHSLPLEVHIITHRYEFWSQYIGNSVLCKGNKLFNFFFFFSLKEN